MHNCQLVHSRNRSRFFSHVPSPTPSLDLGMGFKAKELQDAPGVHKSLRNSSRREKPRGARGWRIHRLPSRERQACPAHPGMLEITSRTLAAVMYDAEDPCSVNTAYEPESSFTTTPRSTTRPLYVWNFLSSSKFCKMNCFAFFLCLCNNLLFAFFDF